MQPASYNTFSEGDAVVISFVIVRLRALKFRFISM